MAEDLENKINKLFLDLSGAVTRAKRYLAAGTTETRARAAQETALAQELLVELKALIAKTDET